MSDPTAIQVPPTPPVVTSRGGGDVRVPAQVINDQQQALPPQTDTTQRVRAEVISRTDDGSVRVQVNGGEIELRPAPPPRENTVQRNNNAPENRPPQAEVRISSAAIGRQIEIEIPAQVQAQATQSATVRAEQVVLRLESSLVQNAQPQQVQVTRNSATPVQVNVPDNAAPAQPQVSINAQTGLPATGEVISLQPLSLSDTQALIRPQISNTQNAALVVNTITSALTASLIEASSTQLLSGSLANITAPTQTALNTLTIAPSSGAEASTAQLQIIPALISAIPAAIAAPQAQGVLPQGLASLNVVQPPSTTVSITSLIASAPTTPISAQINSVTQPQISLIAPDVAAPPLTQQAGYDEARIARESALPNSGRADRVSARFEGLTQQGQPVFSADLAGQTISATAFGQGQSGAPLFALDYALTDAARASLQSLPQGLQVELSLARPAANGALQTATTLQASLAAPSTLPPITSFLTAELWPAANTLYQNIAQVSAQAANAFAAMTPSPANAAQFGPAVMFFVAAMRSGDVSGWLGNKAIDALQKSGKGQSLSKFMSDGASMSRLAAEPAANDWRAMSIPLMYGERVEKVALYYKSQDGSADDESDESKGGFNRFIFNLKPNNMGKVQLDGLYRGGIGKGRLDLALRTEAPFTQAMKMEMRRIYVDALEGAGVSGELSFQNNPESWVTITPEKKNFGANA